MGSLIHDLWMLNLGHGVGFLWEGRSITSTQKTRGNDSYDFLGREDTELHLLNLADGSR